MQTHSKRQDKAGKDRTGYHSMAWYQCGEAGDDYGSEHRVLALCALCWLAGRLAGWLPPLHRMAI